MTNSAIVTGCSSGLGLELVKLLADGETAVVGVSRAVPDDQVFSRANVTHIAGDVAAEATAEKAFEAAQDVGDLDLVISCAGVGVFGEPGGYSRKDIDDVLAGTLIGTILFSDRAFAQFSAKGHGTIVNVMSTAAHAARPMETVYTAAKWGARGYTDALRAAAKGSKIRVIGVYPGGMKTPFWTNSRGMETDASSFSEPNEIAKRIVAGIAPGETSYVTDLMLNRI